MSERRRLEAEALIIAYAMSRLGTDYLAAFGHKTWKAAFEHASSALDVPAASFKNLRDEFDPFLSKERKGWHGRAIRPNRQAILQELSTVEDEALKELVRRSFGRDLDAIEEVVDLLLSPPKRLYNVAERLLTGRIAEDFFFENSESICGISRGQLRDTRQMACGYDFGVSNRSELAIEVKGLRASAGQILFTDREWSEASARRADYWLVVVGDLTSQPRAKLIADPSSHLSVKCEYVRTASAVWRANASI